jgi:polyisoprenyl-phosphate glycosyltransferase
MPADPRLTVVLPVYNERDHVLEEIERIQKGLNTDGIPYELLVVDDGSSDGSAELAASVPGVRLIKLPRNSGVGVARRVGTEKATGQLVAWTDCDLSYPNDRFGDLVRALDATGADHVVGAREKERGTVKFLRTPAKWFLRKLAEYLSQETIPDLNSGMRVFKREVAEPYLPLLPRGFSCVSTLTLAFLTNDHSVRYVPIEYRPRAGKSKFHPVKDTYKYLMQILRMIMYFNPLRVLAPPALVVLGVAVGKFLYDLIAHPFRITGVTILLFLAGFQILVIGLLADLMVNMVARRKVPLR